MTLLRHAAIVIVVCALSGVSDTPRVPSEEAYILSDMWETYRSLIRQRDRLLHQSEGLDLERGIASSDSLYVVLDLCALKAFVKIHAVTLEEIPLLSVAIENRPEEACAREFVLRECQEGSGKEDLDASADQESVSTSPKPSFWDLFLEPGLLIRMVGEPPSRYARNARPLKSLIRRVTSAMERALPFGPALEGYRIRLRMSHEHARMMLISVPVGARFIVIP